MGDAATTAAGADATTWKLVWWRFRRHRLAMASAVVLGFYLLIVLFAPFFAPYGATTRDTNYVKGPPELPKVWDNGLARPYVDTQITRRGAADRGFTYTVVAFDGPKEIDFFVRGEPWKLFGLIETERRLFGTGPVEIPVEPGPGPDAAVAAPASADADDPFASVERDQGGGLVIGGLSSGTAEGPAEQEPTGDSAEATTDGDAGQQAAGGDLGEPEVETIGGFVHLLGTDDLGRDQFSRLMYATRTSLTIGLAGLVVAFILGLFFGGLAGYFSGWVDYTIQRLIEIVRSIPTIPLVMGLAAAFPQDWSNLRVFFFTSIILGLVGWTTLARRVRSMLLTLRDEDFVVAARLSGAGPIRVVVRHMLPSFFSYIVITLAIEFPYMILAESVLSFVGLGLRPPTVSWGVLLQEAQRVEVLEQTPWLLFPAVFVIVVILAFNFLGDGLRDAADPYQESS
jgi:ABC-type dipeptide/oligopeptide/nickel transport system permease subunit